LNFDVRIDYYSMGFLNIAHKSPSSLKYFRKFRKITFKWNLGKDEALTLLCGYLA